MLEKIDEVILVDSIETPLVDLAFPVNCFLSACWISTKVYGANKEGSTYFFEPSSVPIKAFLMLVFSDNTLEVQVVISPYTLGAAPQRTCSARRSPSIGETIATHDIGPAIAPKFKA